MPKVNSDVLLAEARKGGILVYEKRDCVTLHNPRFRRFTEVRRQGRYWFADLSFGEISGTKASVLKRCLAEVSAPRRYS